MAQSQSPEQGSPRNRKANAGVGARRRLLDIALILMVSALVGVGVWAIASARESALLSTVVEEDAPTKEELDATKEDKDESKAKDAKEDKEASSSKEKKKRDETSGKDEESAQADDGEGNPDEEAEPAAEGSNDTEDSGDEGFYSEESSPEQSSSAEYGSDPEASYDLYDDPAQDASQEPYDQTPAYEPEPAQEPTTITVEVVVDGTPAGGDWRDVCVTLDVGATVYDALLASGASVNARNTAYGMYVAAIDGLAEKDFGSMSGWVYAVNGVEPPTACSNYRPSDGDCIVWTYVNVER